jgi:hypothetical protein
MPKLKFSLPSYRRHKFSGQAIVTLNGKDHYLRPWQSDTSKTEYKRLLAEWVAAGKTATATATESTVDLGQSAEQSQCSPAEKSRSTPPKTNAAEEWEPAAPAA